MFNMKEYQHKYHIIHKEELRQYRHNHRKELNVSLRNFYKLHPEGQSNRTRNYMNGLKSKAFEILGNKCSCGYIGLALQIDHVKNNGHEERKRYVCNNGKGLSIAYRINVYKKIISGSKDYCLLCANCNIEKELLRRRSKLSAGV